MKGLNKENKLNKLLSEGFYKELLIELGISKEKFKNITLNNIVYKLRLDDFCKKDDWDLECYNNKTVFRREDLNFKDGKRNNYSIEFDGKIIRISKFNVNRNFLILQMIEEIQICLDKYGNILILIKNASYYTNGDIYYNVRYYKYSMVGDLILDGYYEFKENNIFLMDKENILAKFNDRFRKLDVSLENINANEFFIPKCFGLELKNLCGRSIIRISDGVSYGCFINIDGNLEEKYMPVFAGDNFRTLSSNWKYDTLDELINNVTDGGKVRKKIL